MGNIPGKPFTDVLGEVENGEILRELTGSVYDIIRAVSETRKPGKLKLTMSFAPTGKGAVKVDAEYDASIPEHDRPSTMFFIGPDFELLRRDPNQLDLPLRQADIPNGTPLRAVD